MTDVEKRIAAVEAKKPEQPTAEDLAAFVAADAEDPHETITFDKNALG